VRADTVRHHLHLFFAADVAGVDAHFIGAAFDGENRKPRGKMDIRHDGQGRSFL